jgi:rare lipoprotein A
MLRRTSRWIAAVVVLCSACVPHPIYISGGGAPAPPARETPLSSANRLPTPVVTPHKTAHPVNTARIDTSKAYQIGVSSYYGKKFHGRKTANGEIFNMYKLTAAHRVLPLGTHVRVTNLSNGRWVEVKVNDRGPFIEGRILDLSFAAALEIEMVQAGTARVMIEIIKEVD